MAHPQIHLRSIDEVQVAAWRRVFGNTPGITISHGDWFDGTIDGAGAVVSPANSFGFMGGGLDRRLRDYYGSEIERKVRHEITVRYDGDLPVGECFAVPMDPLPTLIVLPTVRTPRDDASSTLNAYYAFRALLRFLRANPQYRNVLVPGLCSGVAGMPPWRSAAQMAMAWGAVNWQKIAIDAVSVTDVADNDDESLAFQNDRFMRTVRHPF